MNNRGRSEAVIVYVLAAIVIALLVAAFMLLDGNRKCHASEIGTASYYTVESCIKESGQYTMANKEVLNDNRKTAADWQHAFGTRLKVSRLDKEGKTIRSTIVMVTDRGPSKKLVAQGRIIDLSYAAMRELNGIEQGVIPVRVEEI